MEPIDKIYLPVLVLFKTTAITAAQKARSKNPVGKFFGKIPPSFVTIKISLNHAPAAFPCGKEMVFVFETIDPSPLDTIMVPRVAINAGSSKRDTKIPLINPNKEPHKRITKSTSGIGSPPSMSVPPISAQQIATVPMDKSIPPVEITKVTPIAINAT